MRDREKKEKQCLNCGCEIPNRNVYVGGLPVSPGVRLHASIA